MYSFTETVLSTERPQMSLTIWSGQHPPVASSVKDLILKLPATGTCTGTMNFCDWFLFLLLHQLPSAFAAHWVVSSNLKWTLDGSTCQSDKYRSISRGGTSRYWWMQSRLLSRERNSAESLGTFFAVSCSRRKVLLTHAVHNILLH